MRDICPHFARSNARITRFDNVTVDVFMSATLRRTVLARETTLTRQLYAG